MDERLSAERRPVVLRRQEAEREVTISIGASSSASTTGPTSRRSRLARGRPTAAITTGKRKRHSTDDDRARGQVPGSRRTRSRRAQEPDQMAAPPTAPDAGERSSAGTVKRRHQHDDPARNSPGTR